MASRESGSTGLGTSAVGTPRHQANAAGTDASVYQPVDGSRDFQNGILQTLGAIQILNGVLILALGVFLMCLQYLSHHFRYFFFFTFYTGFPLWGAVFFIGSGSLTVAAGKKPTRMMIQNSFGMNVASTVIALVGIAFLSVHLALNSQAFKSCQSSQLRELCIYLGSSSNGLVSLMLIFTLLELGITICITAMWCQANFCGFRETTSSSHDSVESGIPPEESDSKDVSTQPQPPKE